MMNEFTDATLDCELAIVGGGIAGPALAAALADRGYRIVLIERSADPLDTARGDHLQPVSCEWLARWGVLDLMIARGAERRCGARWQTPSGELVFNASVDALDIPHPYFLYLNHELISEALLERAAANPGFSIIRPGKARVIRDLDSPGRHGLIVNHDGVQTRVNAHCIAIADGRASPGRKALGIEARIHNYQNPFLVLFAPRTFDDVCNDVQIYFTSAGIVSVVPRILNHWKIGFPMSRTEIGDWSKAAPEVLGRRITRLVPALEGITPRVAGVYPVAMVNAEKWVDGNCVLLGDACHALHPGRSQGMNVALRNVAALADILTGCNISDASGSMRELLSAFEARHKAPVDERLEFNHARGLEMDSLESSNIARMQATLAEVAASEEQTNSYCMRAAGY